MLKTLSILLEIQELDMKMLRLMRLKRERQGELKHIEDLRKDLKHQLEEKQHEIFELSKNIQIHEHKILEIKDLIKKLEGQQSSIKKVDEFNALTQEMSAAERERLATEHATSNLIDRRNMEEEILQKIKESLASSEESSLLLEKEIRSSIQMINTEGKELKAKRDQLLPHANPEVLKIYERLLANKRDRVIVPIENRNCNGCHISLTAQHENLVRKGERLIFCEHCSRILFWPESEDLLGTPVVSKRRRRRTGV
jgi:uncharacterized protein